MGKPSEVITLSEFRRDQFSRLLVLRNAPEELAEWIFQTRDIPDDVLEAAISHAIKTRVFFPVPAELRADADAGTVFALSSPLLIERETDRERRLAEPLTITGRIGEDTFAIPIEREWRYDCTTCNDSGYAEFWCGPRGADPRPGQAPWWPVRPCNHRHEHAPHSYVTACACVETNPTIRRRADARARKFNAEPSRRT
jgi:hypothetical protein